MKFKDKLKAELDKRIELCKEQMPKNLNPLDINIMGMIGDTYRSIRNFIDTIDDDTDTYTDSKTNK